MIIVYLLQTFYNPNGMLDFECQHGPIECQANKIHACAIDLIAEESGQLEMTNCMIKDNIVPELALMKVREPLIQLFSSI